MDVTLLERRTLSYGASGRSPGWIYLQCRIAGFALDIARAGRAMFPDLLRELPGGFEFRPSGGLMSFTTPEQRAIFEKVVEARRLDGLDVSLIDGAQVRRLVPPIRDDVLGASYFPEDAQMVTSSFVDALGRGARAAGAVIQEGVTVDRLTLDGDRVVGVETDAGRFDAGAIVVAMGAWSTALLAGFGLRADRRGATAMSTTPQPFWVEPLVYGPNATKQYALFRDLPSWDPSLFKGDREADDESILLPLLVQRASGEVLLGCATASAAAVAPRIVVGWTSPETHVEAACLAEVETLLIRRVDDSAAELQARSGQACLDDDPPGSTPSTRPRLRSCASDHLPNSSSIGCVGAQNLVVTPIDLHRGDPRRAGHPRGPRG